MLNPFESKILVVLLKKKVFLNTSEVARAAKISWNTAEKYLDEMHERGWLIKKGRAKVYWKALVQGEGDE